MDISSATAWVAPDLLKALAILSDTTVGRSAVGREDLNKFLMILNKFTFETLVKEGLKKVYTKKATVRKPFKM